MTDELGSVLAANQRFYRAFAERDIATMEALWAEKAPVSCIHPGWPALSGRADVLAAWRQILASPEAPRIRCHREKVSVYRDLALVLCQEVVAEGMLVASNLFAREDGSWRMVHHQASPLAPAALDLEEPPSALRN